MPPRDIPIGLANNGPFGRTGQSITLNMAQLGAGIGDVVSARKAQIPATLQDGSHVMLEVSVPDVHDPTELPSYLAGYSDTSHRGEEFIPPMMTPFEHLKLRNFTLDDAFQPAKVETSGSGMIREIDFETELVPVDLEWRGIGAFVGQQVVDQAQPQATSLQPLRAAARKVHRVMRLDREIRLLDYLCTNTNWASGVRLTTDADHKWDDITNESDPIVQLQSGVLASSQPVDIIGMPQPIVFTFFNHPSVRDYLKMHLSAQGAASIIGDVQNAVRKNLDIAIPGLPPIKVIASKVKKVGFAEPQFIAGNAVFGVTLTNPSPTDGESINTAIQPRLRGISGTGFDVTTVFIQAGLRGVRGGTLTVEVCCETIHGSAPSAGFHINAPLGTYP